MCDDELCNDCPDCCEFDNIGCQCFVNIMHCCWICNETLDSIDNDNSNRRHQPHGKRAHDCGEMAYDKVIKECKPVETLVDMAYQTAVAGCWACFCACCCQVDDKYRNEQAVEKIGHKIPELKEATVEEKVGGKVEPILTETASNNISSENQTLEKQREEIRKLQAQIKTLEQKLNPPKRLTMTRS